MRAAIADWLILQFIVLLYFILFGKSASPGAEKHASPLLLMPGGLLLGALLSIAIIYPTILCTIWFGRRESRSRSMAFAAIMLAVLCLLWSIGFHSSTTNVSLTIATGMVSLIGLTISPVLAHLTLCFSPQSGAVNFPKERAMVLFEGVADRLHADDMRYGRATLDAAEFSHAIGMLLDAVQVGRLALSPQESKELVELAQAQSNRLYRRAASVLGDRMPME